MSVDHVLGFLVPAGRFLVFDALHCGDLATVRNGEL
jgi:hypothetical protein